MIQLKPFFIETKDFLFTYHGGGFSEEKVDRKRSNIKNYSKASQRRLVLYLESVMNFTPNYLFFVQYPNNPDFETAFKQLKSFLRTLSNKKFNKKGITPLFIWKRLVMNGCLTFEVLTNFNSTINQSNLVEYLRYIWEQQNPNVNFNILQIEEENRKLMKMDFCVFRADENSTTSTGRWWGVINRSAYKCKEAKKVETSLSEIVTKESELSDRKVSNNFYKKR